MRSSGEEPGPRAWPSTIPRCWTIPAAIAAVGRRWSRRHDRDRTELARDRISGWERLDQAAGGLAGDVCPEGHDHRDGVPTGRRAGGARSGLHPGRRPIGRLRCGPTWGFPCPFRPSSPIRLIPCRSSQALTPQLNVVYQQVGVPTERILRVIEVAPGVPASGFCSVRLH